MFKFFTVALLFFGPSLVQAKGVDSDILDLSAEVVAGEYVIQFHEGVENNIASQIPFQLEKMRRLSEEVYFIRTSPLLLSDFVIQEISKDSRVRFIEPNFIYRTTRDPNDPFLSNLWGMTNLGKAVSGSAGEKGVDIRAKSAWKIHTGTKKIIVAVIDTGIDYTHPDLENNMWLNKKELYGKEGVDDDNNGYVDDLHGYSFYREPKTEDEPVTSPLDDNGHGTHVSGVIGAEGNNGLGIVGVNWEVSLMAVKFLGRKGGGTLAGALESIAYARKNGAHVMNNSWGGRRFSQILKDSIMKTKEAGIVFVAAAGNSWGNNDKRSFYPANYAIDNVISVAAINNQGELARFSNYGKKKVHVAAPGVFIYSTWLKESYRYLSGTSMASPFIAGLAALLISSEGLDYKSVIQRLISSSKKDFRLKNKVVANGWVDAYYALANKVHRPDPKDPEFWSLARYKYSTPHPYKNNSERRVLVSVPGARQFSLHFSRFETQKGLDKLLFFVEGMQVAEMSGYLGKDVYSPIINGDQVELVFQSNDSRVLYGFDIQGVRFKE